jgi:hypothetical protein
MTLQESIRNSPRRGNIPVPTPEWPEADGKLFAKQCTMAELGGCYDEIREDKRLSKSPFTVAIVAQLTIDAENNQVFTPDAAEWLHKEAPSGPVRRLFAAIDELNCLSETAREGIRKNSETTPD